MSKRLIKIDDRAMLLWSSYLSSFGLCKCTEVKFYYSMEREILVNGLDDVSAVDSSVSYCCRDTGTIILSFQ